MINNLAITLVDWAGVNRPQVVWNSVNWQVKFSKNGATAIEGMEARR